MQYALDYSYYIGSTKQPHTGDPNMQKPASYYAGLDAKQQEISGMGFEAARDKFNADYPVGQKWAGSADGLAYSQGEFEALCRHANIV